MKPVACLQVDNLSISSETQSIVRDVSFRVYDHDVLALVGESGAGKSMVCRTIMGLLPSPSLKICSGTVFFQGDRIDSVSVLKELRGKKIAYIPQSPMNALNPVMTIGHQLVEAYVYTNHLRPKEKAIALLKRVGFLYPELVMASFPHQLSGGMRQRVLIAMALMNDPKLLIADEPTTALDVTLQAEILDLLIDLKQEHGLSILLVTHDLGIVAKIASHVVILKKGEVVETGNVDAIFYQPQSEYTRQLLEATFAHPLTV
jgi:ABC-type dipeptide/oligopeptide/nickel transport system ATPase component